MSIAIRTLEQELEYMTLNKDKFIKVMGEDTYHHLLMLLREGIEKKQKDNT